MNRTDLLSSRGSRAGVTLAAIAGVALLAGCAPAAESAEPSGDDGSTGSSGSSGSSDSNGSGDPGSSSYADGTYTAEGTYATPESVETISVTVTLENDIVTAVEVTGDPQKSESRQYQGQFIGGISEVVVGEDIDELQVSRVAGSSLTSGGFNAAIVSIKAEAAA